MRALLEGDDIDLVEVLPDRASCISKKDYIRFPREYARDMHGLDVLGLA